MSFKIERLVGGEDIVVFRVSGRIAAEHVDMLRELLEKEKGQVALDLEEVTIVNREAIRLFVLSETNGVELRNCVDYIREWVARERRRNDGDRSHRKKGEGDDIANG
jgi:hypothetical protein